MTPEVARTMGHGLTRLESYLPSTRGAAAFGEMRRMLDQAPQAQREAQTNVDEAGALGATVGARYAQQVNERERSFWGRTFGVSAQKRAEEAQKVENYAAVAGLAAAALAEAKVRYDERKRREAVGRLVWQVVNMGALTEGVVNEYNDALRWRVLDALELNARARDRLATTPVPQSHQTLQVPRLETAARDAVATYAFHAYANAVGEDEATRRIVPLLVRLGLSRSAGDHFARVAQDEYLSERDPLSRHYRVLQLAVVGIGRHLFLPLDVMAEAAGRVVAFDPYEAARAENRQFVGQLIRASGALASIVSGGTAGPAMSIAVSAAQQLFGAAADRPAIEGAFVSLGQETGLPQPSIQSWLTWNS
ncbi:hypothetical protein [Streptomyces sp. NPDC088350]|uniref:hypothetical protein n=1 Tax=Streptomyces sp. NPDC088350 TaxID=3365854 RepID=UPI0037FF1932